MVIHLISGPRNISTALMYSFAQRKDTSVMDEPFYGFYLLHSQAEHPGKEEIMANMEADPKKVIRLIKEEEKRKGNVFVKNMGHHLQGFDWSSITTYQNVFLIREPKQMLASYNKVIANPKLEDVGLEFQVNTFKWLQNQGENPLVLDGNEVRKNPRKVLTELCNKLNIPFEESMLKWEAGARSEDGIWAKHWYGQVHKSTEFSAPDAESNEFPISLQPVLDQAQPLYNFFEPFIIRA